MNPQSLLANIAIFALAIPIIAIMTGGLIAVSAIMTKHQRQMTEKYKEQQGQPELLNELQLMRKEIHAMRTEINTVTIAVDDINSRALPNKESGDSSSSMPEEN